MRKSTISNLYKFGKNIVIKEGETKMKKVISLILTAAMSAGMVVSTGCFAYAEGGDSEQDSTAAATASQVLSQDTLENSEDAGNNLDDVFIEIAEEKEEGLISKVAVPAGASAAGVAVGESGIVSNAISSICSFFGATGDTEKVCALADRPVVNATSSFDGEVCTMADRPFVNTAISYAKSVGDSIVSAASSTYSSIANQAKGLYDMIPSASEVANSVSDKAINLREGAKTLASGASEMASSAYSTVANKAKGLYDMLPSISGTGEEFKPVDFTQTTEAVEYDGKCWPAVEYTVNATSEEANIALEDKASTLYEGAKGLLSSALNLVQEHQTAAWVIGGIAAAAAAWTAYKYCFCAEKPKAK